MASGAVAEVEKQSYWLPTCVVGALALTFRYTGESLLDIQEVGRICSSLYGACATCTTHVPLTMTSQD